LLLEAEAVEAQGAEAKAVDEIDASTSLHKTYLLCHHNFSGYIQIQGFCFLVSIMYLHGLICGIL